MSYKRLFRRAVAGFALVLLAAGSAAAGNVPISDFFSHNTSLRPELSPSGRYLSVVRWDPEVPDRNLLAIYDLKDRSIDQIMTLKQTRMFAQEMFWDIRWLTDDHIIVSTAQHYGARGKPALTGRIYSINLDEGRLRLLQAPWPGNIKGFEILRVLRDDPLHIVTANYPLIRGGTPNEDMSPSAYLLDTYGVADLDAAVKWGRGTTANGHRIMTSPLANGGLLADREGVIRLAYGWDPDTGEPRATYRTSAEDDWESMPAAFLDRLGSDFLGLTPDGKDLYFLGYSADAGMLSLYRLDPETGQKTTLFSSPKVGIDDVIWGPEHRRIAAVETMYGIPKLSLLDGDGSVATILTTFSQAFPGQYPRIVSWSKDGSKAVVRVSSDRNPGKYYLLDVKTMHAQPLFEARPDIDPDKMASMRPIEFKARDGTLIHGYLTLPTGESSDLPMIVLTHGGPHGIRDQWTFNPMVQLLANRGYAVLQINYRGSIGYGWSYTEAGFGHWGTTMQYDIIDGTRWAIDQGYANPDRICIYGASYGAFAALRSAEIAPELYQCTAGYSGIYDLNMLFEKGDIKETSSGRYYIRHAVGFDPDKLAEQSPVNHVRKLKGGIFIIHGGKDRRAPVEHAEELTERLDAIGKDYRLLLKPNEGHGFSKVPNQREMAGDLLAFFGRWTGS